MSLLRNLWGQDRVKNLPFSLDRKQTKQPQIVAPGTKILYDPDLVNKLKNDHAQLVDVYAKILASLDHKEYEKLSTLMDLFLAQFNAHALSEYIKLYVFLDYTYRDDKPKHDTIMRFRMEMNEIGKVVRKFAHYWRRIGVSDINTEKFRHQLEKIGAVLTKRIQVEETQLYEIYNQAPEHFASLQGANH